MRTSDPEALRARLDAYTAEGSEDALGFLARAARDFGWTADHTARVFEEYKRFCFLAGVSETHVTPSDDVDQLWHLHLQYSRSYWEHFCPEVLGFPLHHGPTRGGLAEGQRFDAQYAQTRALYRRCFREHPPVDIWPGRETRFGRDVRWIRVNRDDVWILPKPRLRGAITARARRRTLAGVTGLSVLGLSAWAWADDRPANLMDAGFDPYALNATGFLKFYAFALTVVFGLAMLARVWPRPLLRPTKFPKYLVAFLRGGRPRVVETAMATLMDEGKVIHTPGDGFLAVDVAPASRADAVERAVLKTVLDTPDAAEDMTRELDRLEGQARQRGLIGRERWGFRLLLCALPAVFVAPRIVRALEHDRPFGFLIVLASIGTLATLLTLTGRLSRKGRVWLRRAQTQLPTRPGKSPDLSLQVAHRGRQSLRETQLADLASAGALSFIALGGSELFWPKNHDSSFGGTGLGGDAGCGGGGCGGGGCGGGGCGG